MKNEKVAISIELAKQLYKTASEEAKNGLESLFGKKVLSGDVHERLKDLDDCYEETGLPKITHTRDIPDELQQFFLDVYDGVVSCQAWNEGQRLSFKDTTQKKWTAWLNGLSSGGVAFHATFFSCSYAFAGDASRLRLISDERAKAMLTNPNFQKVFEKILNS